MMAVWLSYGYGRDIYVIYFNIFNVRFHVDLSQTDMETETLNLLK